MAVVFRDGQQINDCYEVDVDRGRAWRFCSPLHLCDCGDACAYIDTGTFSVAQTA